MGKGRLEAFSDGVIAVTITIMVLELKVPIGAGLAELQGFLPSLLTYALSFVLVGIFWNNHHHLLHAAQHVDGLVLWTNLHWLFWLSLVPFVTGWVAERPSEPLPTSLYGAIFFLAGLAYLFLQMALVRRNGRDSLLARAIGRDWKGKASAVLYLAGFLAAFARSWVAYVLYLMVALLWIVPDRRIERRILQSAEGGSASGG